MNESNGLRWPFPEELIAADDRVRLVSVAPRPEMSAWNETFFGDWPTEEKGI